MRQGVHIIGTFQDTNFQVKTEAPISATNQISIDFYSLDGGEIGTVIVRPNRIEVGSNCVGEDEITHPGTDSGGIWTFLKTNRWVLIKSLFA